jgi:hypothetical protein
VHITELDLKSLTETTSTITWASIRAKAKDIVVLPGSVCLSSEQIENISNVKNKPNIETDKHAIEKMFLRESFFVTIRDI